MCVDGITLPSGVQYVKQADELVVSRKQRDSQSHEDKEEALGSQGKPEERCYGADRPFAIPKADWIVPFFSPKLLARGHCVWLPAPGLGPDGTDSSPPQQSSLCSPALTLSEP